MKSKHLAISCFSLMAVGLILCACSRENVKATSPNPLFQIAVLNSDVGTEDLGQTWDKAWQTLQDSYPAKVEYIFTENDIESYDWSNQIITLTSQSSQRFLKESEVMSENQDLSYLLGHAFVVSYDNTTVYGGLFLPDFPYARGYWYPVIYPDILDKKISFKIRPYRQVFDIPKNDPAWAKITDQRIETFFTELGKLIR